MTPEEYRAKNPKSKKIQESSQLITFKKSPTENNSLTGSPPPGRMKKFKKGYIFLTLGVLFVITGLGYVMFTKTEDDGRDDAGPHLAAGLSWSEYKGRLHWDNAGWSCDIGRLPTEDELDRLYKSHSSWKNKCPDSTGCNYWSSHAITLEEEPTIDYDAAYYFSMEDGRIYSDDRGMDRDVRCVIDPEPE